MSEQVTDRPILDPVAAEIQPNDLAVHFSVDMLDAIGPDMATELLAARIVFLQGRERDEAHSALLSEVQVEDNEFKVSAFAEGSARLNMWTRTQALMDKRNEIMSEEESVEGWNKLDKNTLAFYQHYTRYKRTFEALEPEAIAADLTMLQGFVDRAAAVNDDIEGLFAEYDRSTDDANKLALTKRISYLITTFRLPDSAIITQLPTCLLTEALMRKFEILEAETTRQEDLMLRFGLEGPKMPAAQPADDKRPAALTGRKFRPLDEIWQDLRRCDESLGGFSEAATRASAVMTRFLGLVAEARQIEASAMEDLAARVLQRAEDNTLALMTTVDFGQSPFSMLGADVRHENSNEAQALLLLAKAQKIEPLRQELALFMRNLKPDQEWGHEERLAEARQRDGTSPLDARVTQARHATEGVLAQHLEYLITVAKPVVDILHGTKLRFTKHQQQPTVQEVQAQKTYDDLHKAGFSNPEKNLVVAIAEGRWEDLKALLGDCANDYAAALAYAEAINAGHLVAEHPLAEVVQFSYRPLLEAVQKTIRRMQPGQISTILRADQQERLNRALAEIGGQGSAAS